MLSFDELLAPITPRQFRDEYLGRKPLYIPAGANREKRALLDWDALNRLIDQSAIWTGQTLRLMHDRVAVPPWEYCQLKPVPGGGQVYRPCPDKVEVFVAGGASLVANEVQTLHPPITDLAAMLSRVMAAQVGANVYCSFNSVQALGSHYDAHDVFAVQTEGEKIWRLYENQIELPVDLPPDVPETPAWLESNRGKLMTEIRMKPGDVMYLPRGRFHDALAVDGASLHVTFSVTPLYGRILFSLLDNAAMQVPAFRAYFPPASEDGGRPLAAHLARLGEILKELAASPAFLDEVRMSQDRLTPRPHASRLPRQAVLTWLRPTGRPFPGGDAALQTAWGWCREREKFSLEDLVAEMDFIAPDRLRAAVAEAEASGALARLPS